jgi:hypothetical protein
LRRYKSRFTSAKTFGLKLKIKTVAGSGFVVNPNYVAPVEKKIK